MQEVEAICDRVIIIDKGKIVTDKKLNNLVTDRTEQIIEVEFDKAVDKKDFTSLPDFTSASNTHDLVWELTFSTATDRRSDVFDFAQNNSQKNAKLTKNECL